jgi:hypothetical protein
MEPEFSIPCLQEPTTALYPEPDESTSHLPHNFSKISFNNIIFQRPVALMYV